MYQAQLMLVVISMAVLYFAVMRQIFAKVMNYVMLAMAVVLNVLYWWFTKDDSIIFIVPVMLLAAVYSFYLRDKIKE